MPKDLVELARLLDDVCDISESRAHESIDLADMASKAVKALLAEISKQQTKIAEMKFQIEDLRAELRRDMAAMDWAINQASPDYGEP